MTMGRNDAVVVPDPTILIPSSYYHCLADESTINPQDKEPYVYSFFIRNRTERYNAINSLLNCHIEWNDEDSDCTIQGWLSKIKHSTFVITDSFHCMVMCLKLHKPFVVVTDVRGNVGMNDRFYTLLSEMNLTDHVIHKSRLCDILVKMQHNIHWLDVDKVLEFHKSVGREFLLNSCRI
jgi:exopolysaccharide biosynthesis predicted pyruvyltransferase EpsI